ncbi:hypothetical protein DUNSADRAFT_18518 [Dunaliella salina]|uniref:Uncharacterized protein n=1 Tax=Dunaliella salina TaxID=3046 RepID=A0ABQ7G004_DUNSA|nr:hypothetical protein DUNSADRAFT_18518 [Dunaliella salina]|eukprot:KAF5827933.1 hypothetical protein DUNSADRAFT_18518 [Dunaliella salina]
MLHCPQHLKSLYALGKSPLSQVPRFSAAKQRQLSVLHSTQQQREQGQQHQQDSMPQFELIEESVAYKRYLTLFDRQVRVTSEKTGQATTLAYDVIGHPRCNFRFAVVLPFHTASKDAEAQILPRSGLRDTMQHPSAKSANDELDGEID